MPIQRQLGFWLAALFVAALALFVLRDILLPFVAGLALAYLLDPIATVSSASASAGSARRSSSWCSSSWCWCWPSC
jgi:predicted PurR-regulated permease PerM